MNVDVVKRMSGGTAVAIDVQAKCISKVVMAHILHMIFDYPVSWTSHHCDIVSVVQGNTDNLVSL